MKCTTVMDNVAVGMAVKNADVGRLWVHAEAALSAMLDRDEIEIGASLGSGSFATVHRAVWRGTPVAVKLFRDCLMDIQELCAEVMREVDLCTNLRHPNIGLLQPTFQRTVRHLHRFCAVQYFGAALTPSSACIVMELATNGSLTNAIEQHKLDARAKLRMAYDVASGMNFLHTSRVIHRDLKVRCSFDVVKRLAHFSKRRFTSA